MSNLLKAVVASVVSTPQLERLPKGYPRDVLARYVERASHRQGHSSVEEIMRVASMSDGPYLLPWTITRNGKSIATWNMEVPLGAPRCPRRLVALNSRRYAP